MPPKSVNAVNTVVNDLIRAAAGSSARNIADEDIDKYVADIILKEAEERKKKLGEIGLSAYKPTNNKPKPKPNTKFLLNMVKATDSHNQAVIRANEENVAKLRRERLDRERRERERHDGSRHKESHSRRYHTSISRSISPDTQRSPSHTHNTSRSPYDKHTTYNTSISRSRSRSPQKEEKRILYKGRGKVKINVSMDKYFQENYNPQLDNKSDEEMYVYEEVKKKKKSKKKKKKKESCSRREWDVGK